MPKKCNAVIEYLTTPLKTSCRIGWNISYNLRTFIDHYPLHKQFKQVIFLILVFSWAVLFYLELILEERKVRVIIKLDFDFRFLLCATKKKRIN